MSVLTYPDALTVPPEPWERLLATFQRWCARHPDLVRRLRRVVQVAYLAALVLTLLAVAFLPRFGAGIVPALSMTLCLAVITLLARTRTIGWRTVATLYGVGVPWALLVALGTVGVAALSRLRPGDDGMMIALAAFVEEPGKLVPLLLLCALAPGRVRRFAAVDWALAGYAAGAAFVAAEDGVRRLRRPGLLDVLLGNTDLPYSWNPWASGTFPSVDKAAVAAGHQVWTMNIAMGIGLGLVLWRSDLPRGRRVLAWVPALALAALSITDHAGFNAHVTLSSWPGSGGEGFPWWLWLAWTLGGQGRLSIPLSVVLFLACLLADARGRVRAGWFGVTVEDAPGAWQPALTGLPDAVRKPLRWACALVSFTWSDLAVLWAAHRGTTRVEAMIAGRQAASLIRGVRADAMAVGCPGEEPAARRRFRRTALLVGVLGLVVCLGYGSLMARDIGHSLLTAGDHPFFAGLLDSLASWWQSIGVPGQVLALALGLALVIALGGSLALALGVTGVASWVAGHGAGLADLLRDPEKAVRDYLANATPGQVALDVVDLLLTFVPGGLLGKLGGTAGREVAAELRSMLLWKRVPAEVKVTLKGLVDQHADAIIARDAAVAKLEGLLPNGYKSADFTAKNWDQTRAALEFDGLDAASIADLRDAAKAVQKGRVAVTRLGAQIGEVGGETLLARDGYRIPEAFLSSAGTPGGKLLDGLAFRQLGDKTEIAVAEYKGVTARLDKTPRPTQFEGLAAQATPAYVRDRLLTDPRVADFFAANPDLWQKAKAGEIDWTIHVISTKSAEKVVATKSNFTLTNEIIDALQKAVEAIVAKK